MINNDKLADIEKQYNLLRELEQYFKSKLMLTPCIGLELEFYIHGDLKINLLEQEINCKIQKEKGKNQYEINIPPSQNLLSYSKFVNELRQKIIESAQKLGVKADFGSKPFVDDYGSSMHVHLNFLKNSNSNLKDNDIDKYAKILCHYLPETIKAFLPKKEDYLRLDSKFMAPTHIAYGNNNRTLLIRIPDSSPRRLEHRLPAADADVTIVIYNILQSIKKGIEKPENIKEIPKIFGNAFDPQYKLQKISYT